MYTWKVLYMDGGMLREHIYFGNLGSLIGSTPNLYDYAIIKIEKIPNQ